MSYFNGGNSVFSGFGGNFNLGNSAHGFTGLGYDAFNSGFNLANNAYGFNGLGFGNLNSVNPGNNANGFSFANDFGFGGANTQITPRSPCPPGCYYPIPGQICTQGDCPNGCCQLG